VRDDTPPPWLPDGSIVSVAGRGEFFVRRHVHPDPSAPTVLLLHGWTASSDLQFLGAYRQLAEVCSFAGLDHRGHGRGVRSLTPFTLEDVADDAAAVVRELGLGPVIVIGYSMGGPIAMHVARRHGDLVSGLIVQATALEWSATRRERLTWWLLPIMGAFIRSRTQPRLLRAASARMLADDAELAPHRDWLVAETMRSDPRVILEAGKALRHHDARDWAADLRVPAGSLISTRDRLVKPRKQRALAAALGADVVEVAMDHLGALEQPDEFAAATVELISRVAATPR
jgi:3-oxoadipate enol-lactonase